MMTEMNKMLRTQGGGLPMMNSPRPEPGEDLSQGNTGEGSKTSMTLPPWRHLLKRKAVAEARPNRISGGAADTQVHHGPGVQW
jgi:hypothetical protein